MQTIPEQKVDQREASQLLGQAAAEVEGAVEKGPSPQLFNPGYS